MPKMVHTLTGEGETVTVFAASGKGICPSGVTVISESIVPLNRFCFRLTICGDCVPVIRPSKGKANANTMAVSRKNRLNCSRLSLLNNSRYTNQSTAMAAAMGSRWLMINSCAFIAYFFSSPMASSITFRISSNSSRLKFSFLAKAETRSR